MYTAFWKLAIHFLVFTMNVYHVDRYLYLFLMSLASVAIQLGILLILNMNANPVGLLDNPEPHSYPFQRKIPLRSYHEYLRKYIHIWLHTHLCTHISWHSRDQNVKINIGSGINHKIKNLQMNTVQVIKLNSEYWIFLGYESTSWGNKILTFWRKILSLLTAFSRVSRSFLGIYGPLKMRSEFLENVWIQFPWTSSYPRTKSSATCCKTTELARVNVLQNAHV
jgi:hypothetical protein